MNKKDRKVLFGILGIDPWTEEQAMKAQERLEEEAKRIKTWLANANRPRCTQPKIDIDLS